MYRVHPDRTAPHSLPPTDDRNFPFQEEEAVNLRAYWIVIRKYRWSIMLFCLPIVLITAFSARQTVRTYTASATLYIENQTPNIMGMIGVSSGAAPIGDSLDFYATQLALL